MQLPGFDSDQPAAALVVHVHLMCVVIYRDVICT